ncbi:GNAT family N-acetyltransferase [Marinobacter sp. HL-58]|uniref:GNAT family N-acetyltransferase n=1 Tax=Marinobacter sp. HL-58 TaxID=1479237 RepID=UPI000488A528|nr:N-acetyltransferase [Marinobacter sp. HL-58]KPP98511.1 MAG: putative acetyltransferase [Marinobacter sp. HL-58]
MKFSKYNEFDRLEIEALFTRTFSDSEGEPEGKLIGHLVHKLMNGSKTDDIFGFIAAEQGQIVGCIFFTRLSFGSPIKAFMLSPVAIETDHQGKGIGQKLINIGIKRLRELGVEFIFTYGDPNYYSKVGFEHVAQEVAEAPFKLAHPEGWLGQSLDGGSLELPLGQACCVEAFNDPQYW